MEISSQLHASAALAAGKCLRAEKSFPPLSSHQQLSHSQHHEYVRILLDISVAVMRLTT
jgi:hypothetical protein